MMSATHNNRFYVDWIVKQYKKNAEIAALCTGAFMLGFSGLLRHKKCTTHWQYANEFRYFYPQVELIDEKIIVEHNGLYSSGGSNAYWNLLLFLVERFVSRELSIQVAKYFVVNLDKVNQTPFIIFNGLKDHEDTLILQAQEFIEANYPQKITVDELADKLHLTRRTFERRFKKERIVRSSNTCRKYGSKPARRSWKPDVNRSTRSSSKWVTQMLKLSATSLNGLRAPPRWEYKNRYAR